MDCNIVHVEQGTDEWDELRHGRITASRIADVMAKPSTKRYKQYRREKILELLGHVENAEEAPEWARHGREMEPRAIAAYEWRYDCQVIHDCFLIHKEHDWLGASPDMLMLPNLDEGGEIKCRALFKNYHLARSAADRGVIGSYKWQLQTCMWLTGFDYWWFVNYYYGEDGHGGLVHKLSRSRIYRDDKLIAQIEARCKQLMEEVWESV
jgi:putative phage-type endonuclease